MKRTLLLYILLLVTAVSWAQKKPLPVADTAQSKIHVHYGNKAYRDRAYTRAIGEYDKALAAHSTYYKALFNTGNAHYQLDSFALARQTFLNMLSVSSVKDPLILSHAHYNIGNTYMKEEQYAEAVTAYKNALRLNPSDADFKYNLTYALKKLKQQQSQDQNNEEQQDGGQGGENDQQEENKDDSNGDNDNRDRRDEQDQQQQDKNPGQKDKMSREEMEAMLQSLNSREKEIQKNRNKGRAVQGAPQKDW